MPHPTSRALLWILLLSGLVWQPVSAEGPATGEATSGETVVAEETASQVAAGPAGDAGVEGGVGGVAGVAERYRDTMRRHDLDAMAPLLAPDAHFADPTAAALGMTQLAAGIQGRRVILDEHRKWQIESIDWTPQWGFESGEHSVVYGVATVEPNPPFPFLNILRIEGDQVVERLDYGDYSGLTARIAQGAADPATKTLVETAKRYVEAYSRDMDTMQTLLAEDAEFQDPTAGILGPGMGGEPIVGNRAIADWFRAASAQTSALELSAVDTFYAPHHAVFIGEARAQLIGREGNSVTLESPLAIVLEIRDGRVVRHHDYWNAEAFLNQVRAAASTAEPMSQKH